MPIKTSLRIHLTVHLSFDSIDERLALRDSLQCKPFSWYLSNVYPDLRVPEAEDISFGSIRQNNLCLDTLGHLSDGLVGLYGCHGAGGNQDWSLTKNGHIKHGSDLCVALESPKTGTKLRLRLCNNSPLQVSYSTSFEDTHCSKSSFFCPKIQLWFPEKMVDFLGWNTRENVVFLDFLAVDNFDFTKKLSKKKLG